VFWLGSIFLKKELTEINRCSIRLPKFGIYNDNASAKALGKLLPLQDKIRPNKLRFLQMLPQELNTIKLTVPTLFMTVFVINKRQELVIFDSPHTS
jgi:hypothetical protein